MIRSFSSQLTEDIFYERVTGASRRFPFELRRVTLRKLQYLNAAEHLSDLQCPPGNHLERLKGDLKAFYSIRVNNQWRIIFRWKDGAHAVEVLDYHRG